MQLSPLTARRLQIFRSNRRGWWSMWIFMVLFVVSLFAEFVANDKPLLIYYKQSVYLPIFKAYPEKTFGGDFQTETDYGAPYVKGLIEKDGWMLWPPIRYHHKTVTWDLQGPAPSPPDARNLLGTDDQARDVLRLLGAGELPAMRVLGNHVGDVVIRFRDPEVAAVGELLRADEAIAHRQFLAIGNVASVILDRRIHEASLAADVAVRVVEDARELPGLRLDVPANGRVAGDAG